VHCYFALDLIVHPTPRRTHVRLGVVAGGGSVRRFFVFGVKRIVAVIAVRVPRVAVILRGVVAKERSGVELVDSVLNGPPDTVVVQVGWRNSNDRTASGVECVGQCCRQLSVPLELQIGEELVNDVVGKRQPVGGSHWASYPAPFAVQ
jgi:hypothetical protein